MGENKDKIIGSDILRCAAMLFVVTYHIWSLGCMPQIDFLVAQRFIMLGGEILKDTNCSSGEVAEEQIKKYTLDLAFLGAGAIDAKGRLNDWYSPEARFKKTIFSVAEKVYVLVDSSKFNNGGVVCYGDLSQITGLITDAGISEKNKMLLKQYNVELIIAE